jgi:hypothetical protein
MVWYKHALFQGLSIFFLKPLTLPLANGTYSCDLHHGMERKESRSHYVHVYVCMLTYAYLHVIWTDIYIWFLNTPQARAWFSWESRSHKIFIPTEEKFCLVNCWQESCFLFFRRRKGRAKFRRVPFQFLNLTLGSSLWGRGNVVLIEDLLHAKYFHIHCINPHKPLPLYSRENIAQGIKTTMSRSHSWCVIRQGWSVLLWQRSERRPKELGWAKEVRGSEEPERRRQIGRRSVRIRRDWTELKEDWRVREEVRR